MLSVYCGLSYIRNTPENYWIWAIKSTLIYIKFGLYSPVSCTVWMYAKTLQKVIISYLTPSSPTLILSRYTMIYKRRSAEYIRFEPFMANKSTKIFSGS
jgi:hypothetical protein